MIRLKRILAFLIDVLIIIVIWAAILFFLLKRNSLDGVDANFFWILPFYFIFFETVTKGFTVGKKLLGVRLVCDAEYQGLSFFLRSVLFWGLATQSMKLMNLLMSSVSGGYNYFLFHIALSFCIPSFVFLSTIRFSQAVGFHDYITNIRVSLSGVVGEKLKKPGREYLLVFLWVFVSSVSFFMILFWVVSEQVNLKSESFKTALNMTEHAYGGLNDFLGNKKIKNIQVIQQSQFAYSDDSLMVGGKSLEVKIETFSNANLNKNTELDIISDVRYGLRDDISNIDLIKFVFYKEIIVGVFCYSYEEIKYLDAKHNLVFCGLKTDMRRADKLRRDFYPKPIF